MPLIRPEISAAVSRWSEVLTGLGIAAFGLWAMLRAQGVFFQGLSALVVLAGLALAALGWRRMRFRAGTEGPGIVQIVEGQISYFGPTEGGFIALADLRALSLVDHGRLWLLTAEDGTRLKIPAGARGAEALFDAFARLPGLRMQNLLDALDAPAQEILVWRHPALRGPMLAKH